MRAAFIHSGGDRQTVAAILDRGPIIRSELMELSHTLIPAMLSVLLCLCREYKKGRAR
jgi:hypothetical protein